MTSYRLSHSSSAKSAEYHAKFTANAYRALHWEFEKNILDSVVRRMAPQDASYLDFACGTGRVISHVALRIPNSTGIDVSESMLSIAKSNTPSGRFIHADLTVSDPFEGTLFDVITAFRFFANAEDELRKDAMMALAEKLAPGGILIFNNHKNSASMVYAFAAIVRKKQRNMSHEEVCKLVTGAGLRVVECHHVGVVPASERVRLLPISVLRLLERLLARVPLLGRIATNRIYVCSLAS